MASTMAKKHRRRLVIDANVARSAGNRHPPPRSATSAQAVSVACHQFLNTVRDVGYHVVMTTAIRQEWLRHRSNFSATWLIQMYGRRQVHRHDAEHDEDLRRRIAASVSDNCQQAAEKDVHLIEAALGTDRLVASQDEKARGIFRYASQSVRELKAIVWVNPTLPADDPIGWLRNGAQSEARRRLGSGA